jgi:predicted DNA repair protein MutK
VRADRELPVVWAVAKGSAVNKAILVPAALLISALAPALITPLLMLGGAFLCYEGVEKLAHRWLHSKAEDRAHHRELLQAVSNPELDLVAFERDKIKGAVRTDFILSAEIIVITLGSVAAADFPRQLATLVAIAIIMTIGVYGLVAGIVKLDDLGLHLSRATSAALRAIGHGILRAAPWLMKFLSIAGTAAMFLVGGGILVHGVAFLHHPSELVRAAFGSAGWLGDMLFSALAGILAGAILLAVVQGLSRLRRKPAAAG